MGSKYYGVNIALMTKDQSTILCFIVIYRVYYKDLRKLNRDMSNIIIVDNNPDAYAFQPENALPILSWYDDYVSFNKNSIFQ